MILGHKCPLCDNDGKRIFRTNDIWIRECLACAHRWAEIGCTAGHVDRVYDDSYFLEGGAGYPDYIRTGSLVREHGRDYARLLKAKSIHGGRLLAIGTAAGFDLLGFQEEGWTGSGVEPNERMATFARGQLGLDVKCTSFEEFEVSKTYDLITMIQVLPHLADPLWGLRRAVELLNPHGYLLIETWNRDSRAARMLGRLWHEYSPPSVLHWFNFQGLVDLLDTLGCAPVGSGRPRKRIDGAHIRSIVGHKLGQHRFLRLLFPLLSLIPKRVVVRYRPEDLFWVLFQRI